MKYGYFDETKKEYVITGTVEDILPKMIKYYKKNSK